MQRVISKERGRDFSCVLHAVAIIFFSFWKHWYLICNDLNIKCFDWIKWNFQELEKLKKENKELYEELMELRRQIQVRIFHTIRSETVGYFVACITQVNGICTT